MAEMSALNSENSGEEVFRGAARLLQAYTNGLSAINNDSEFIDRVSKGVTEQKRVM